MDCKWLKYATLLEKPFKFSDIIFECVVSFMLFRFLSDAALETQIKTAELTCLLYIWTQLSVDSTECIVSLICDQRLYPPFCVHVVKIYQLWRNIYSKISQSCWLCVAGFVSTSCAQTNFIATMMKRCSRWLLPRCSFHALTEKYEHVDVCRYHKSL